MQIALGSFYATIRSSSRLGAVMHWKLCGDVQTQERLVLNMG